eukprot:15471232-Alexandrium_andersonii.AAC.1
MSLLQCATDAARLRPCLVPGGVRLVRSARDGGGAMWPAADGGQGSGKWLVTMLSTEQGNGKWLMTML